MEFHPHSTLSMGRHHYYSLVIREGARLTDFGENQVWRGPTVGGRLAAYRFRMVEADPLETEGVLQFDFLEASRLTEESVPWLDGLALWEPGRISVQYPLSAGSGEAGSVRLTGAPEENDLHTSVLELPEGQTVQVQGLQGPLILRSQGRMKIDGVLARTDPADWGAPQTPAQWLAEVGQGPLTDLLTYASAAGSNWTVLVAGGDLEICGDIVSRGPVILAAGGKTTFLGGKVRCPAGQLYVVGRGGGWAHWQESQPLDVGFTQPDRNPLRQTKRYGFVTTPLISGSNKRYEWEKVRIVSDPGNGGVSVRFLSADGPIREEQLVEHPRLLPDGVGLRMLIEISVPPGGMWSPPLLDSIRLFVKTP